MPLFTAHLQHFTGPLSRFKCTEAYLHFQCVIFFSPREFQSTCSIYPRWKKPVLCYKCITPQGSFKQLWFEGKNLAAGERNDMPWLGTSPRGSWIFSKEGDSILRNHRSRETASISSSRTTHSLNLPWFYTFLLLKSLLQIAGGDGCLSCHCYVL